MCARGHQTQLVHNVVVDCMIYKTPAGFAVLSRLCFFVKFDRVRVPYVDI